MIPILRLAQEDDRRRFEALLDGLRINDRSDSRRAQESAVQAILADVAARGDAAVVDVARKFDAPTFTAAQLRVAPAEMAAAAARIAPQQTAALTRAIEQVRQYQQHVMPHDPPPLQRPGVALGLRFTPLASVGLLVPGGKAAYPSTLVMLAVPAQVAGVGRIAVCTPRADDLVLAVCHMLGLRDVFRAGGAAAVGALAFGTASIPAVDKIVGPGNVYAQLAKRAVAGTVGIDGFLGPSEILVIADDSAKPTLIAADMIAQAEHDPGSCFLLTTSDDMAAAVAAEIQAQLPRRQRRAAIESALDAHSAIVVDASMDRLTDWANRFAAEHVSLQTRDDAAVLARLRNAGAVFCGPYSPVAAGDYVAGPSHCLPTNTTARFASGVSVYEFLKRTSIIHYDRAGLAADALAIKTLANAEGLDAHAASIDIRESPPLP